MLHGRYYLVACIEGNDRKSFFEEAESDNGVDGFRFWDYPILLEDTCPEEVNVYDMRLTKHEDGCIYGVFCSESKDASVSDLPASVASAGIVRTKNLRDWERLPNPVTLRSPQQRNVVLHPEFVDGQCAFYTRPMDDFIDTGSGMGFGLCCLCVGAGEYIPLLAFWTERRSTVVGKHRTGYICIWTRKPREIARNRDIETGCLIS